VNITQLSQNIYQYETYFSPDELSIKIRINTWLIRQNNDVYIIDTGISETAHNQIKIANMIGSPQAILLTHGHRDHVGGAKEWRKNLDIPIFAHENEFAYIDGEKSYLNRPILDTGLAGVVQPISKIDNFHLPLKYYLTPGHSPGHIIFYHEPDNVLLVGDLFVTGENEIHPPLSDITTNMNENIRSASIIDEIKPRIISSSHGYEIFYNNKLYEKYKFWYEKYNLSR